MTNVGVHTEHEDQPWTIEVGDHPGRTDSPQYTRSRNLMIKLVQQTQPWWFGSPPYQDHHGGGIWLKDATGWFLVFGLAGIEWSAQFCADPAKVDKLRQLTARLVAGFPDTTAAYDALGYHDATQLLTVPITDANGVAAWTDGIFNASVALPAGSHTGVRPTAAGYHHYPKPIVDIEAFKYDDFNLFVADAEGNPVAVTPVAPRQSGNRAVHVAWADPHTPLGHAKAQAEQAGGHLVLPETHPCAQAAFANQAY
jgi:hypothetical protein